MRVAWDRPSIRVVGFSVKLAPGVRVRASSRGVRTSIGPRAARVHIGAGRAGISTGAGPVGFYSSLGGTRSRGSARGGRTSVAQSTAALKAQQAHALLAAIEAIEQIHRQEFVPASRPIVPDATVTTIDELRAAYEQEAMKGVGLFARSSRKQARVNALAQAQQYHAWLVEQAEQTRAGTQAELDEMWRRLLANDQEVVIGTLAEAFEDNDAAAAPVGVHDGAAAIVVLVPTVDVVPERAPALTAAGNLSLKKMTKGERVGLFNLLVFGHLIVTAREAFAVAPGLRSCRLVALRNDGPDLYGKQRASCIFAVRFDRAAFDGIRWSDVRADDVVQQVGREIVVNLRGAAKEFMPIELSTEPDLRAVVDALSLDDLGLDDTR
jgi:hypothetical protein